MFAKELKSRLCWTGVSLVVIHPVEAVSNPSSLTVWWYKKSRWN